MIVTMGVPGATMSPALAGRSETMPLIGALRIVSSTGLFYLVTDDLFNAVVARYEELDPAVRYQAQQYTHQALRYAREIGNRREEAQALRQLAIIASQMREYHTVFAYLEDARRLFREVGDRGGEARMLNLFGESERTLGNYPQAAAYYRQALENIRIIGERNVEVIILNNLYLSSILVKILSLVSQFS